VNSHTVPAQKLEISVVVACRNERRHIRGFLESLLAQQTNGLAWEVLIADAMSEDGTREILKEYATRYRSFKVLDNPDKIASTGLNLAIRAARGDVIVRMDAHTEYQHDYIQCCVETLRNRDAENVGGPARTKADGVVAEAIAVAYHSPFSTGGSRFHQIDYEGYVDTVTYGCWRKSTLQRIGLFDEDLIRNQDDELNLRLLRAGGKIWQTPRIVSWYRLRGSISSLFRQYFQYGFWKVPVIRKHRVLASWRHLVPGCFVIWNLALILAEGACWSFGFRTSLFMHLWAMTIGAYIAFCGLASLASFRGRWAVLPLLPVVFAIYHLSYGLGFSCGLLYWPAKTERPRHLGRLFTGLTR
jgi:succinoglycan biosynthesis protein ExoA